MTTYINRGTCISMGSNNKVKSVVVNNVNGNIDIAGGKIYINGKEYTGENNELESKDVVKLIVNIEGDMRGSIESDCEVEVNVNGNVIGTNVTSGMSTTINGDVEGNVNGGMDVKIRGSQKGRVNAGMSVKIGTKVYE